MKTQAPGAVAWL